MSLLAQPGLNRRESPESNGESNRELPEHLLECPGHKVHTDLKKAGCIAVGGCRVHGKYSAVAKSEVTTKSHGAKTGWVFRHPAIDGYSRLAFTEAPPGRKVVTENGSCCRAASVADAMGDSSFQRTTSSAWRNQGRIERDNHVPVVCSVLTS